MSGSMLSYTLRQTNMSAREWLLIGLVATAIVAVLVAVATMLAGGDEP
jgi:hypothetical protein